MRRATVAALEADMAKVALASGALEDVEAVAVLALQRGILDVDAAERVFDSLGRVTLGVVAGRKWMSAIRGGSGEAICEC